MYGRTNAGGGSISPFAFIFATYPAGSVCTCTDGSRTFKLKDTSGYGEFYPPYAGTWTVTATDGTETASETVEITAEGQSVSVELSYGVFFYNKGDECSSITGGWIKGTSSIGMGSFAKNAESMSIVTSGSTCMIIGTNKTVDMTPYKTLEIIFNKATVGSGVSKCQFGLHSNLSSDTVFGASVSVTGTKAIVDVTSVNAAHKIALYCGYNNNVDVQSIKGYYK